MTVEYEGGWTGKVLRINLTIGEIRIESTATEVVNLVGGTGLAAHYLLDQKSGINPLTPKNTMIIATGPCQGTSIPICGRHVVVSKSPLTDHFIDSHAGGFIGPELKKAGYDAVIITGASENPCYVEIVDDKVAIKDASYLWGKSTAETENSLREGRKGKVMSIGIAGENLAKISCIVNDGFHTASRGGQGAVFGSKKLKAIYVEGSKEIKVANPEKVKKVADNLRSRARSSRENEHKLFTHGTPWLLELANSLDQLPTRNFQQGEYENWEKLTRNAIDKVITIIKKRPCYNCAISCSHVSGDQHEWAIHGGTVSIPEYETLGMMGANCGIDDVEAVIKANYFANMHGLDTISTGNVIGFFMECCAKNLVPNEYKNEKIKFGDKEGFLDLLHKIARREGVGKILSEGVHAASQAFGKATETFAVHVKKLEIAAWDPRGKMGLGLSYATAACGGSHLRGWPQTRKFPNTETEEVAISSLVDQQDLKKMKDSLLICHFTHSIDPPLNWQDCADIFSAVTGIETNVEGIKEKAKQIWIACRKFNVKDKEHVAPRELDILPWRLMSDPLPSGRAKGCKAFVDSGDFNRSLDRLYKLRKLDRWGYPFTKIKKKKTS
ncbi:MAG: aldehyde ferredoxin oxidoreductase family protein [Candidatus Hodarchaeales archaeon]|jgi:aldehyde:ferredoxin oxidoreductase